MALPATDAFTDADNTHLATHNSNWHVTTGGFQIVENAVCNDRGGDGGSDCCWTGDTFDDDQYSQAVIASLGPQYMGLIVRSDPNASGTTNYGVIFKSGYAEYFKFVNGSYTGLGTDSDSLSVGNTTRMEIEGTTLRYLINSTGAFSTTDSALSSGYPGLFALNTDTNNRLDDWEGGNLGGAPAQSVVPVVIAGYRLRVAA